MYAIKTEDGIIGIYDCRGDAEAAVAEYEAADKEGGNYQEGYYEIIEG